jgi:hypothetical protein
VPETAAQGISTILTKERIMKQARIVIALMLILLLAVVQFGSVGAQGELIQLVMLLDGSASLSQNDWDLQIAGLIDAIGDPDCFPQDGSVELSVIQFAVTTQTIVDPTIIFELGLPTVVEALDGAVFMDGGSTNLDVGIQAAIRVIEGSPNFNEAGSRIMNISTDGQASDEDAAEAARDEAITVFDEIDAEAIRTSSFVPWMKEEIVWPEPGTAHGPGFDPWPPPGPGWVRYVEDYEEYADTLCEKFQIIVPPEPPPPEPPPPPPPETPFVPEASTLILLGSGVSGLAGYVGLQWRARRRK